MYLCINIKNIRHKLRISWYEQRTHGFGVWNTGIRNHGICYDGDTPRRGADIARIHSRSGTLDFGLCTGVSVGAPLITQMARTKPLKQILLWVAVIYTVASFAAAVVPSYAAFVPVRFLMGFPHGAFFGVGFIVAARLVPKEKSASVISISCRA